MFEARLAQGVLLRKLLDSMKDLVQVSGPLLPHQGPSGQRMSGTLGCPARSAMLK